MLLHVIKADGSKQPYDEEKVIQTCLRLGASRAVAETVAENISSKLYDGIKTNIILEMVFEELEKYVPSVKHKVDLRRALALMKPKPDFECYVRIILKNYGFKVYSNRILRGRCVEHEVDGIAIRNGKTYIVEVKHHYNYHTPTGLDVSRIARAVLEDLNEGYLLGLNNLKIDTAIIVCNTKLSEHARRYADCRGILHIGWNSPEPWNLRIMIEKKKLYPITYIRGLNENLRERFSSAGIILLKQLVALSFDEVERLTKISFKKLKGIIESAKTIMEC
ncbi:MAG: restriction endonuclease [Candidatus Verstraetearchaeota archaeon]|nr:restriction endonuclease [Candidatus Verstraetearchaeota archaeon]